MAQLGWCSRLLKPDQICRMTFSRVQRNRWSAGMIVMFFVFLSQWWYQIGRQPVGCRLKTAGKYAYFGRLSRLGAVWLVQPVGCSLAGAAGGPHGRLASWFSQAGAAGQRSNSITSHTKYFKSAQNWIDSLYLPYLQLAHIWAIFPM